MSTFKSMLAASAIVCGIAAGPAMAQEGEKPSNLTFVTAGQGGSWYAMGGGFARMLTEAGIKTNSDIGAGGLGNVPMISQGRGDLAFTNTIVPPLAAAGQAPFAEPITNVRSLIKLSPNVLHVLVTDVSGVTSIEELVGEKFASQKVGNVSAEAFRAAMAAVGIDENDIDLTRGSQGFGATETKDRRVAGFTATTNIPSPAMSEVTQTIDARLLPVSAEVCEKMRTENAGYSCTVIPAGSYRGQDEDVPTVGTELMIIVNEDMSDNDAYWLTRTFFEHIEELGEIHASLKGMTPEFLAGETGVETHPGAMKYFEEAGLR